MLSFQLVPKKIHPQPKLKSGEVNIINTFRRFANSAVVRFLAASDPDWTSEDEIVGDKYTNETRLTSFLGKKEVSSVRLLCPALFHLVQFLRRQSQGYF